MQDSWPSALERAGYTLIETHISRVFLRGDEVYKTKREVDLGFLDFSTLEARRLACHAEVTLNLRMAPDVYLGVVALVRTANGELAFSALDACATTPVLEWAVHMRRLADDDRADVRLARGQLGVVDVTRIAERLAHFHAEARSDAATARFGEPALVSRNVEENFAQIRGITEFVAPPDVVALASYQRAFLVDQRARIEARARDGFARDGHGDLRLEHLYATADGGYIAIDCIEFNDRFRFADVCADLAFLTMDLTMHERPDLAELLAALYAEETGDFGIYPLIDFYQSYRALVRAKVALLLARDADVTPASRAHGAAEVRRYFTVALAAERPRAPARLIVTFGLIASGKSTLSAALRERLQIPVVSADRTRKRLLGIAATDARHDEAFAGAYGADTTRGVYDALFAAAEQVLISGRSVVLDASFRARAQRERAVALAAKLGVEVVFLECWCTRDVTARRLATRAGAPSVSDGRSEIFDAFAASYEAPDELARAAYLRLDTSRPTEQTLDEALRRLA